MKDRVGVDQKLQGLSYGVCSTNIARIFCDRIIYSSFREMRHYTQDLVAMLRGFMRFVYTKVTLMPYNYNLKQTDAAAEKRRSTSKSPFRKNQGQVNSFGP